MTCFIGAVGGDGENEPRMVEHQEMWVAIQSGTSRQLTSNIVPARGRCVHRYCCCLYLLIPSRGENHRSAVMPSRIYVVRGVMALAFSARLGLDTEGLKV
jgi:hypothetical protein